MRWKNSLPVTQSQAKANTGNYLHSFDEAVPYNQMPGTFTPGSHFLSIQTCCSTKVCMAQSQPSNTMSKKYVDLKIGMVPIVNLEWIQKLIRDTSERGHSRESVAQSIVRSMDDYIHHIVPQFSRTHINFQRVPTVDTSNPFSAKDIPTMDESFVVIRFSWHHRCRFSVLSANDRRLVYVTYEYLSRSRWQNGFCHELILTPLIQRLQEKRRGGGWR